MQEQSLRSKYLPLILTVAIQLIALITFFSKMDSRVASLEKRRDEVNPQRVTQKDIMLIEEKMKHIDSKISDIKDLLKK